MEVSQNEYTGIQRTSLALQDESDRSLYGDTGKHKCTRRSTRRAAAIWTSFGFVPSDQLRTDRSVRWTMFYARAAQNMSAYSLPSSPQSPRWNQLPGYRYCRLPNHRCDYRYRLYP